MKPLAVALFVALTLTHAALLMAAAALTTSRTTPPPTRGGTTVPTQPLTAAAR